MSDSIASENGRFGIGVAGVGGSFLGGFGYCTTASCIRKMSVSNSVTHGNLAGMGTVANVMGGAYLTVSSSVVSNNSGYGLAQFGGTLSSAQNNVLTDNATQVTGTLTSGGIIY